MTESRDRPPPVHLLGAGGRRLLVPATLEATLLQSPRPYLHGQWSPSTRERGLFVDLSHVEWVELEALVQVCLLVESALREGVAVRVALPLGRLREGEAAYVRSGENLRERERILVRVRRRTELRSFLRYLSFEEALRAPHLRSADTSLRILQDYDSGSRRGEDQDDDWLGGSEEPDRLRDFSIRRLPRFAFPLMWLAQSDARETRDLADHLTNVVSRQARGIGRLDAASIANVVLYELVDNAIRHAQVDHALVAAFAWPTDLRPISEEYVDAVQPYMRWLRSAQSSGVEIVVGDSGRGVLSALGDTYDAAARLGAPSLTEGRTASVLAWAFDRYSTSDRAKIDFPDGRTRGLYRVERRVKKHTGLITLRTSDRLIALDHGGPGYTHPQVNEKRLAEIPGALLRVQMLPLRGVVPPRSGPRDSSDLAFTFCEVEAESDGTLPEESRARMREAFGYGQSGMDSCAVIVVANDDLDKLAIERMLREISELRDPGAAAVFVPSSWALVDNACDSLVSDIERSLTLDRESSTSTEALDPVLVIGAGGGERSVIWTGARRAATDVLDAAIGFDEHDLSETELQEIIPDPETRSDVLGTLLADPAIVAPSGRGLRARLHPQDIFAALAQHFSERVAKALAASATSGPVRTRSLIAVKGWLSAERLFGGAGEEFAALRALASRARASAAWPSDTNVIVADAKSVRSRMKSLSQVLHIGREVIISGNDEDGGSGGRPIIGPDSRVIVYADIIASGESVRRCLTQVLRDRAEPVLVVTLVDGRIDRGAPIDFLGWQIPVVALAEVELAIEDTGTGLRNVDSNGNEELDLAEHGTYEIPPDELLDLVAGGSGLHFGHTGAAGDRHFTFYLDAERLLRGPELTEALCNAVRQWRDGNGEEEKSAARIEIWHPSPEPKSSEPAATLAGRLKEQLGEAARVWAVGRNSGPDGWTLTARPRPVDGCDVVIVDWGAIGGATVTQMVRLAAEAGAGRVLTCICLSQLPSATEWYQSSVKLLRVRQSVAPTAAGQGTLLELDRQTDQDVPARTIFLSSLPVAAYPPHECPVCVALDSLPDEEHSSALMGRYAERQRNERLRAHTRAETVTGPATDVDGRPLGGTEAVKLLRLRRDLEHARWSTAGRHLIAERVDALSRSLEENEVPDPVTVRAICEMLRLIALETQWLKRPPFVLERVALTLACLAARVALLDGDVEEADRSNAIIVLQSASESTFAENLAKIYMKIQDNDHLVGQLVYSTLTCIERPHPQNENAWTPLVKALTEITELIDSGEALQAAPGARDMRVLADRARSRRQRAGTRRMTLPEAWAALASSLGAEYQVHGVAAAVRSISPYRYGWWVDSAAGGSFKARETYERSTLPQSWERVESFLTTELVPLLIRLLPVLRTTVAQDALGRDLVARLLDDLENRTWVSQWEFARIVSSIAERRTSLDEAQTRERFALEHDLLSLGMLRPAVDEMMIRPSYLAKFLREAPASLGAILPEIVASDPLVETVSMPADWDASLAVFFPRMALTSMLRDIVGNVPQHHESKSGGSTAPARIVFACERKAGEVVLTVSNTRTRPSSANGVCLKRWERALEGFGGSLAHGPVAVKGEGTGGSSGVELQFTYQTTISFLSE